jgi:DNA-directed RNA polymerase specialized sigma24 family protein
MNTDHDLDLALHVRLMAGDPVAPHDCIEHWLPKLIRLLCSRFPQAAARDEHMIWSAAHDALLEYTQNPHKYNPQKSSLQAYLYMAAKRDLLNSLRSDRTQNRDAVPIDSVEQSHFIGNNGIEEQVIQRVDAQAVMRRVRTVFPGPMDWRILELILQGERSTAVFAEVLGIQHLPTEDQRRIVKQNKDRIVRRLERLGESIHGRENRGS